MNSRKVDELGRIVLPIEIRNRLKINESDELLIESIGQVIILSKLNDNCTFCESKIDLIKIKSKYVCHNCFYELKF